MSHSQPTETRHDRSRVQYLTFLLGREEYGVEVLKVQEIIGLPHITPVPRTPDYVSGLINLRGRVIPVLDLRMKLGMLVPPPTEETCVIIVETRNRRAGLIVDRVRDVRGIDAEEIEPPPELGPEVRADYMLGMAKSPDGLRILLDVDRILTTEDDVDLDEAAGS